MPPVSTSSRAPSRTRARQAHRKIIVEAAISADGFIARPDGDVSWLESPRLKGNYGMAAFFETIDTILMGRKTYAKGIEMGMKASGFGPKIRICVFSRQPQGKLLKGFEWAREPVGKFTQRLRAQLGKDIWMMGGGELIAAFLEEGGIDEFSLHVIPIFIGEGIPLIQPQHRSIPLELLSTRKFSDGVVHLHYRLLKSEASARRRR
ncbi:MAG TPA: dihydrofolate reductase family protein [Acidobacteriaceae bacterium]|nr:dihydrofolate reductase family protein [Acidobacteriaceae bacterium]